MQQKGSEINQKKLFGKTSISGFSPNDGQFTKHPVKGLLGVTWDATHMTSFLNKSFYSNHSPQNKTVTDQLFRKSLSIKKDTSPKYIGQHFFKTVKQGKYKNVSKIGFTKINPLVSDVKIQNEKLQYLSNFFQRKDRSKHQVKQNKTHLCSPDQKFRFQANTVKFRATNPLTSRHQPQQQLTRFQKERMKRLIAKRHPHGIVGFDHPQNPQTRFYANQQKQVKIRKSPMCQTSFQLDRQWKSKKRSMMPVDQWKYRQTICLRKFRNDDVHGYNILTNRRYDQ